MVLCQWNRNPAPLPPRQLPDARNSSFAKIFPLSTNRTRPRNICCARHTGTPRHRSSPLSRILAWPRSRALATPRTELLPQVRSPRKKVISYRPKVISYRPVELKAVDEHDPLLDGLEMPVSETDGRTIEPATSPSTDAATSVTASSPSASASPIAVSTSTTARTRPRSHLGTSASSRSPPSASATFCPSPSPHRFS